MGGEHDNNFIDMNSTNYSLNKSILKRLVFASQLIIPIRIHKDFVNYEMQNPVYPGRLTMYYLRL